MERIVLGSGKLYYSIYTDAIPVDATIEVEENLLGLIQGGATIRYTPTYYTAKDDFGLVQKKIVTDEEAVLTSGIMTFNADTLKALIQTGVVSETSTEKKIKIGGIGNFVNQQYVLHFVHEDAMDGDIRVTMVGSNESGFELAFAKNKETVINAQFKAAPHDTDGTLILYREQIAGTWVKGITLDKSTLALEVGGATGALVATVTPDTAVVKTVAWSTSSETVATVVGGTVTAVGAGTATITATTTDGSLTASCVVTVTTGS